MTLPAQNASKGKAYAKISFVSAVWGFSFIVSKHAMQVGFGTFTLSFVRYAMVCLIMLPLLRAKEGGLRPPERKDWPAVFASGMAGITLYFACEYLGVMRTTVANTSLIFAAIPVLSIFWGAIRGRKYRVACWLGVTVSLVGVFFVVYYGSADASGAVNTRMLLGNFLILLSCVFWVVYIEISDKLLKKYSSLRLTTWQGVVGLVTLLPMALFEIPSLKPIPIDGWASALFLAAICSALCFFWYAQAIKDLSPLQAAIFINLNPIVAVVAGVLLLGESVNLMQMIGGAIVVGSIFLVNVGMNGGRAE